MRYHVTLCAVLTMFVVPALQARPTTAHQAEQAVSGWLTTDERPFDARLSSQITAVDTTADAHGDPLCHIVYLESTGFVIVAGDDLIEPILGFVAGTARFDPSPDNPLGALVTRDATRRIAVAYEAEKSASAPAALRKWETLLSAAQAPESLKNGQPSLTDVHVAPMVQSQWSQCQADGGCPGSGGHCYNYYTPNNWPCGCVATAMAQVMRFHQYPVQGIGTTAYPIEVSVGTDQVWQMTNTRGGDGMGGPYLWRQMPLIPANGANSRQREAIGALCFDAGIGAHMDYGPTRSSAFMRFAWEAMYRPFLYSNAAFGTTSGTCIPQNILRNMINPNLDYGHPVIVALGPDDGHAVVVDGYGYYTFPIIPAVPPTLYHHLNMGWAGLHDAWYAFFSDMPVGYSTVDACIYNIYTSGAGEIFSGRVTDAYGQPISGQTVRAEIAGGASYTAVTSDKGIYVLAHVASNSTYTIQVTRAGYDFADQTVSNGASGIQPIPQIPPEDYTATGNKWGIDFTPFPGAIFVDDTATGGNTGANWTDAYPYLQDALAAASAGDTILVAAGTYIPDRNAANPDGSGSFNATFQLKRGVALYGGFPDGGCNTLSVRDSKTNETILSGDVGEPGGSRVWGGYCLHVVTGSGTDATAVLDGFTITGGKAGSEVSPGPPYSVPGETGGGMYNDDGSPTVANCAFDGNRARGYGGAMYNRNSDPILENCYFRDNHVSVSGGKGCAIYNDASSPDIRTCTFYGNNFGWAVHGDNASTPALTSCTFYGNSGGVRAENSSVITVDRCIIAACSATAVRYDTTSLVTLTCCALHGNGGGDMPNDLLFTATADTTVDEINPAINHGTGGYLIARRGGSSHELDTLVKFDLTSLPTGTPIGSAVLGLHYYHYNDGNPAGRSLDAHRITQNWIEATTTWTTRPNHASTVTAQSTVPASYGWMEWDVTDDVQDFVDGTNRNYGWKILDPLQTSHPMIYFRSRELGNSEFRPYLSVAVGSDTIVLDPEFCDPDNEDFTLKDSSPCAPFTPPNTACDRIGAWPVACTGGQEFKRGDTNADDSVDVSDAVMILSFLFGGGPAPGCEKSADANDDGTVDISDGVRLLTYLFGTSAKPPAPFDDCGLDPTPDTLTCTSFGPCD